MNRKIIRTPLDIEKLIWQELLKKFLTAKSSKEMERLFNTLTTDQERETIARRLAIISLIRKGVSYNEISKKLWVSPITISTIKKSVFKSDKYKSYYRVRKENIKELTPNYSRIENESFLSDLFDHVTFMLENVPQKSGSRWKFLK